MVPRDVFELETVVKFLGKDGDSDITGRRREDILRSLRYKANQVDSASEVLELVLDTLSERGYKGTRMWAKDGEKYKLVAAADVPQVLLDKELGFEVNNVLLEEIFKREGEPAYFEDTTQSSALMIGPIDPLNHILARYPRANHMLTFSYSSFSNNLALKDFKGLMVVNYDLEDLKDIEVDETGKVSNKEKEFLEKIAEWVVADKVVRMMELNREGVSGLYNQLKFHGDWDRYMNRFHLTGETQGLINIDLDNLKKLNSNYGHLAGDKVLSEIGKMLREMESKDVRPYRQGGDEFAIIIRGDLECARQYGNKLLEEFRNIWVPEGADPRTASIGIAMTEQGIMDGDEWAQRADDALYAAKFKGRNQVCVHDEYDPKILLNRDEL